MKNYNLVVKEEADIEIMEAYNWYEDQSANLGERFLTLLEQCFKSIRSNPDAFQKVYNDHRKAVVQIFPFVVIYEKSMYQMLGTCCR